MASLSYGGSDSQATTTATATPISQTSSLSDKIKALLVFLRDETDDELKIMGRTPLSWGKLGLFYLIFYTSLALFFAMTLGIFYQTTDWDYPKLQGSDSILANNPGLGYRPVPDVHSSLMRFVKGKPATYKVYTDHIKGFLDYYENAQQNGDNFMECRSIRSFRSREDWEKVCKFDLSLDLGPHDPCISLDDYGYDDGTPCIILKLNKIYGWMPEPYINNTDVPDAIKDIYDPNFIHVTCEGEGISDKENIGEVIMFPPNGFHVKFYPYLNQQGYRQPVVFAHFSSITNGVVVMVRCQAYARNIRLDRMEQAGSVHFELLID